MSTELQTRQTVTIALNLTNTADTREFCKVLAGTDMVPKAYKGKADDIFVAVLHGQEIGLPPLQALQSVATINGIPSIYGDAGLAMVRNSGKLDDIDEWFEVDGVRQVGSSFPIMQWADADKKIVAHCMSKRVGAKRPRITTYSVDDAKRALLWEKKSKDGYPSPWCTTPQRMLMFRARSWNLRDEFGDVLKGLAIYEEAMDIDTTAGPDGAYRPVVVATVEEDQADLAEVQAKLKAQREQVQGDGLDRKTGEAVQDTPQQSQDAPAPKPAEQPAIVDPFKEQSNGQTNATLTVDASLAIPKPKWEQILSYVRAHADLNDLRMDWEKTNKVKNSSNLNVTGQQAFLNVMRNQVLVEFPY